MLSWYIGGLVNGTSCCLTIDAGSERSAPINKSDWEVEKKKNTGQRVRTKKSVSQLVSYPVSGIAICPQSPPSFMPRWCLSGNDNSQPPFPYWPAASRKHTGRSICHVLSKCTVANSSSQPLTNVLDFPAAPVCIQPTGVRQRSKGIEDGYTRLD